jgi:hypothetical protein
MKPAFTKANAYLFDPSAWSWSLPSGTTCPGAEKCLAFANRETGKLRHGKKQEFLCYSAVTERFPSVRGRVWTNFEAVRGRTRFGVKHELSCALPLSARLVRIHSGGDFFSQEYFDGWLMLASSNPRVRFWAFTKSVDFWVKRLGSIPPNLELQASYGGRHDHLIGEHGLKFAKVVNSKEEADALGLELDTDDRLAAFPGPSFALLENFAGTP